MILPRQTFNNHPKAWVLHWLSFDEQFRTNGSGDGIYWCTGCGKIVDGSLFQHKIQHCMELGLAPHVAEKLARKS